MSVLNGLHGYYGTPVYRLWRNVVNRCENKGCSNYQYYGARGIKMDDVWRKDPGAFCDWALSNGYGNGLELDRIDVNGNYAPWNCQFITHKENCATHKRRIRRTSKTGIRCVYPSRHGTYEVHAYINGKQTYIGSFKTINDAIYARDNAETRDHLEMMGGQGDG